jgi:hypothetical protein
MYLDVSLSDPDRWRIPEDTVEHDTILRLLPNGSVSRKRRKYDRRTFDAIRRPLIEIANPLGKRPAECIRLKPGGLFQLVPSPRSLRPDRLLGAARCRAIRRCGIVVCRCTSSDSGRGVPTPTHVLIGTECKISVLVSQTGQNRSYRHAEFLPCFLIAVMQDL